MLVVAGEAGFFVDMRRYAGLLMLFFFFKSGSSRPEYSNIVDMGPNSSAVASMLAFRFFGEFVMGVGVFLFGSYFDVVLQPSFRLPSMVAFSSTPLIFSLTNRTSEFYRSPVPICKSSLTMVAKVSSVR